MSRWRAASLVAVHLLAAAHFLHWKLAGETLAPVEPSEMFDTLHLGVITVGAIFMLGLVLATALAGRFFCGWGCHILALQDLSSWILRRLRIPTRPIRSRTLVWVPLLAALYLFVWPQIERAWQGKPLVALHVVEDPDGWTSFTTDDLLRSFPGPIMTATTFVVCGLVVVYFLGSRSFCAYACPYGAIFAAVDRIAPLRVVAGDGDCSSCGACIASCQSSVRVIQEVRSYGAVVNANCMKDLDCVSVCPTDALKLGFAAPPAITRAGSGRRKSYDFTRGEDVAMALVFAALFPFVRGLYEAISFLLALAVAALLAYAAVVGWRLCSEESLVVAGVRLKVRGRFTRLGGVFGAGLILLSALVAHSVFVRAHVFLGDRAYELDPRSSASAIDRYETAAQWGFVRPRGLNHKLAALYEKTGRTDLAKNLLNEMLADDPGDHETRLNLARVWLTEGRTELAKSQAMLIAEPPEDFSISASPTSGERRARAAAYRFLADVQMEKGNRAAAIESLRDSLRLRPNQFTTRMLLGTILATDRQDEEAVAVLASCVESNEDSALAHNNLAAVLARLGRDEEALTHYRACLLRQPSNLLARCNFGFLLIKLGRLSEAEEAFKEALNRQADCAEAQQGLRLITRERGSIN